MGTITLKHVSTTALILALASTSSVLAAECDGRREPLEVIDVRGAPEELVGKEAWDVGRGKLCVEGKVYSRGMVVAVPKIRGEVITKSCRDQMAGGSAGTAGANLGATGCN